MPGELGSILQLHPYTLQYQLNGSLPAELGHLPSYRILSLNGINSGVRVPAELGQLTQRGIGSQPEPAQRPAQRN
jgi:hypothetical protein